MERDEKSSDLGKLDTTREDQLNWDDVLEWEERRPGTSFWTHAAAGSVAGITEHVCLYPVDTIKTHMQAYRSSSAHGSQNPMMVVAAIRADFGALGLLRGLPAVVCAVGPAHAAQFALYEHVKASLEPLEERGQAGRENGLVSTALVELIKNGAIAGAAGWTAHDTIMTPCDVIKQRMQLGCYDSVGHCVREIMAKEGFVAFYRSYPTTLAMNIPFGSVFCSCNNVIKKSLGLAESGTPSEKLRVLPWYFLSAGMSSAVAAFITQPLDIIKTRLQTQDVMERLYETEGRKDSPFQKPRYAGFSGVLKVLYAEDGLRGFYRGVHMRMLMNIPSGALSWGTYEFVKNLLASD
jgi:solute carrier family 25 iron transporter 28/37